MESSMHLFRTPCLAWSVLFENHHGVVALIVTLGCQSIWTNVQIQPNQIKSNAYLTISSFPPNIKHPQQGDPTMKPEKGGRKPAPSPQTSSYSPVWSRLEAQTICSTCFATLRPPFLNIIPHPLANYLVPNPNGRCSPLSFGAPPFSSIFPLLFTIFLHFL